jgi:hypothetical protein
MPHANVGKTILVTGKAGFQVLRQDLASPYSMYVDEIYNLACPASSPHCQRDPIATFKTRIGGPSNVGNPGEFTMLGLAEKVIAQTKSRSKLVFRPLPGDDPKQRKPDIASAKARLDWEPVIKLEESLARTIECFKGLVS